MKMNIARLSRIALVSLMFFVSIVPSISCPCFAEDNIEEMRDQLEGLEQYLDLLSKYFESYSNGNILRCYCPEDSEMVVGHCWTISKEQLVQYYIMQIYTGRLTPKEAAEKITYYSNMTHYYGKALARTLKAIRAEIDRLRNEIQKKQNEIWEEPTPSPESSCESEDLVGTWIGVSDDGKFEEKWEINCSGGQWSVSADYFSEGKKVGGFTSTITGFSDGKLSFTTNITNPDPYWPKTSKVEAWAQGDMLTFNYHTSNDNGQITFHRE